jgi:opacity protein-like surface antigen
MHRRFLFFLVFCFSVSLFDTVRGQEPDTSEASRQLLDRFSFGLASGVNFGTPQGELKRGKWQMPPGSIQGFYLEYKLSDYFDFHTELAYESLYLTNKMYYTVPYESSYRRWDMIIPPSPSHSRTTRQWDFNFYRVPVQIQFHTRSRLRFELAAGISFGFLNQATSPSWAYPIYLDQPVLTSSWDKGGFPQHDVGYSFAAGLEYSITEDWNIGLSGRYYSGNREFLKRPESSLESLALTMHIGYSPKGSRDWLGRGSARDSLNTRWSLTYKGGMLLSNHRGNQFQDSYSYGTGFTAGVGFQYLLDDTYSLKAELLYQRKGYHLDDSSRSGFRMASSTDPNLQYNTDTRVGLDYFSVPLLLDLRFGRNETFFVNGGFYYSYNFNAKATGTQYEIQSSPDAYRKRKIKVFNQVEGYIKDHDWGWVVGTGLNLPLWGANRLEIEMRYDQSFADNFHNLGSDRSLLDDRAFFNESIQWTVGFQVPVY